MNIYLKLLTISATIVGLSILGIVVLSTARIALPLAISTTARTSELAVTGTGKIDVTPDIANVDIGITVSSSPSVADTQQKINTVNNKIIEEIKKLNIKAEDIKTSNYSINPEYDPVKGTQSTKAYMGNANIRVKVKDISQVSKVVETATAAGANQILGVAYAVDDVAKYREEARNKAIENAKDQANKLSSNLGLKIGKITNLVENSVNGNPIYLPEKATFGFSSADAGANFAPGTQTVESTVTVYFEKE